MNIGFADRESRRGYVKPALIAAAGLLSVAVAIGINLHQSREADRTASEPQVAAPAAGTSAAPQAAVAGPSFDVVRINPQGDMVMAGRATPGAVVVVEGDQAVLGEVTADPRGEWVFLPETPLAPGNHLLQLRVRREGGDDALSPEEVLVVVPGPGRDVAGGSSAGSPSQPLALRLPRDGGPATVLQKPIADAAELSTRIDAVDWQQGRIVVDGHAPAGARLRLTIDGKAAGEAVADAAGHWQIAPRGSVTGSKRLLALEQLDRSGAVVAQMRVPFAVQDAPPPSGERTASVQRGGNLWRIARSTYGRGTAYTIIYDANRGQIGDPDRIFPGQVFRLPEPAGAPAHD